jgi:hypothetical protein
VRLKPNHKNINICLVPAIIAIVGTNQILMLSAILGRALEIKQFSPDMNYVASTALATVVNSHLQKHAE